MLSLSEPVPVDVWSQLSPGSIQLWQLQATTVNQHLDEWQQWLSGDEAERASRFRRDCDRQMFVLSRGGLR